MKRDTMIMIAGIVLTLVVFGVTVYFRSGAF